MSDLEAAKAAVTQAELNLALALAELVRCWVQVDRVMRNE